MFYAPLLRSCKKQSLNLKKYLLKNIKVLNMHLSVVLIITKIILIY